MTRDTVNWLPRARIPVQTYIRSHLWIRNTFERFLKLVKVNQRNSCPAISLLMKTLFIITMLPLMRIHHRIRRVTTWSSWSTNPTPMTLPNNTLQQLTKLLQQSTINSLVWKENHSLKSTWIGELCRSLSHLGMDRREYKSVREGRSLWIGKSKVTKISIGIASLT